MKTWKRIAFIVGPLLILVILYLVFTKGLITLEGEAKIAEIKLPSESQDIHCYIEEAKFDKLKWKKVVLIRGWFFHDNPAKGKRTSYMVLKSKNDLLVFTLTNNSIVRTDVSAAFPLTTGVNEHGFEIMVPSGELKDDVFQLGFVIDDETGQYYTLSNQALKISDGQVSIIVNGQGSEPMSHKVSIDFKPSSNAVSYYFDKIETNEKSINILGWSFLKDTDAQALKTYILLKKEGQESIYDVFRNERKDITAGFGKAQFNLDSSGFLAKVPVANLESGKYQVGLYLTKGSLAGIVYSDKFIELKK